MHPLNWQLDCDLIYEHCKYLLGLTTFAERVYCVTEGWPTKDYGTVASHLGIYQAEFCFLKAFIDKRLYPV